MGRCSQAEVDPGMSPRARGEKSPWDHLLWVDCPGGLFPGSVFQKECCHLDQSPLLHGSGEPPASQPRKPLEKPPQKTDLKLLPVGHLPAVNGPGLLQVPATSLSSPPPASAVRQHLRGLGPSLSITGAPAGVCSAASQASPAALLELDPGTQTRNLSLRPALASSFESTQRPVGRVGRGVTATP